MRLGLVYVVAGSVVKPLALSASAAVYGRGVVAGTEILVEDGSLGAVERLHAAVVVAEEVALLTSRKVNYKKRNRNG